MSLNPRQKKFALLYVRYGNATRAYGEAYDAPKTDSGVYPSWVSADGCRLVRNEKVREEIAKLKGENQALATMTREETLDYLVTAITTPVEEIGPNSPLCEEYTLSPDGSVKTKSVSKLGAVKELMRLTGMDAAQKVEISGDASLVELVRGLTGARGKES